MELANSTAPFGLAFAQMFTPEVGKVIMALMVMSCCGSLLGWQFTIAQVVLNLHLMKATSLKFSPV
ncbi:putrescine/proton symporter: putrescine/ornithine antiporter [Escherichia coli]|uniref:Putrescine/proton symporter: putrescine/ornithine antiporter n=1 Tax=Escherichia coli TaxID=562 RepID=A0A376TIJ3_ECOLX|nr:putrescine/proton symporter: putrescine/ornithine antiporter [Escherichia coli]